MAETKKETKSEKTTKAAPKAKPAEKKEPEVLTDLNTMEDTQAVPGHFVTVTGGKHEGKYGVFVDQDGENVIVRTRDANSERIVVPYKDLEPAESGKR